jgi:hypothetical protein
LEWGIGSPEGFEPIIQNDGHKNSSGFALTTRLVLNSFTITTN